MSVKAIPTNRVDYAQILNKKAKDYKNVDDKEAETMQVVSDSYRNVTELYREIKKMKKRFKNKFLELFLFFLTAQIE